MPVAMDEIPGLERGGDTRGGVRFHGAHFTELPQGLTHRTISESVICWLSKHVIQNSDSDFRHAFHRNSYVPPSVSAYAGGPALHVHETGLVSWPGWVKGPCP